MAKVTTEEAKNQPQATIKPNFFNMPQNIRDMVYHELWKHTPRLKFCKSKHGGTVELCYDPRQAITLGYGSHTDGLPGWLLINKAFLNQGFKQLHLHARYKKYSPFPTSGEAHYTSHISHTCGIDTCG